MRQFVTWFVLFVGAIFLIQSCTDPSAIGANILEDDRTQLDFFDTVSVEASTAVGLPVTTYAPLGGNFLSGYPSGRMRDPIFGTTDASIYFQVLPLFSDSIFGFPDVVIDSVILSIPYNNNNFYGLSNQEYGLRISRIEEADNTNDYTSDQSFPLLPTPLIEDFRFNPTNDTVRYLDYSFGGIADTIIDSQLRIPLSKELGAELFTYNDLANEDRNLFWEQFPGIAITPTTTTPGMLSFNLIDNNAGIYIYYTTADTINFQYPLNINNPLTNNNLRYVQFEHNYEGTIVGEALDQSNPSQDSIYFLQGMAGPSIRLSFPNIAQLRQQNFVLNKAELEIRIASLDQDSSIIFTPSDEILLATRNEDGEFEPIFDYTAASINREERFGGFIMSEPGEPDFYTMNISAHMQEIINGSADNELFIVVAPIKAENPSRLMIYGPNHPNYPIKLRLAGTVLD